MMRKSIKQLLLLGLLLCGVAIMPHRTLAFAGWDSRGLYSVGNADWRVEFIRDTGVLQMQSGGNDLRQTIQLVPVSTGQERARRIANLEAVEPEKPARFAYMATFDSGSTRMEARVDIFPQGFIRLSAGHNMAYLDISGDLRQGFIPGFFLEDTFYSPDTLERDKALGIPVEDAFAALLGSGSGMFVLAWENPHPEALIIPDARQKANALVIRAGLKDNAIYCIMAVAENLWWRESPGENIRGRNYQLGWHKPFPANWRSSLQFNGIDSALEIASRRNQSWRGYHYPLWFEGNDVYLRIGGAFQLTDDVLLIYPFDDNPRSLMGMLQTIPLAERFSSKMERSGPYRGPGGVPQVGFTACWGTGLLRETLLVSGVHDREAGFIEDWIDSVVQSHLVGTQNRRIEHREKIDHLSRLIDKWIEQTRSENSLQYLQAMRTEADALQQSFQALMERDGYDRPEEYIEYGARLGERLAEILNTPGHELITEYDHIVGRLNHITWAHQESTGGRRGGFANLWRAWFQQAASACPGDPKSIQFARKLRDEIFQHLHKRSWETISY